ncbi:HicB family toxin-antitoxin system [Mycobacterium sherrisii]|uniref:HicB family toxin-antitoxin system n=1 Tax=Mycobacterium sherrisii TaxID=243061 RepID=UPI0039747DD3
MKREYKVEVTRDGRWWMISVPEIDGITQARRISEIEEMARSLIAISTDQPLSGIAVNIASIDVPGIGDIQGGAAHLIQQRAELAAAAKSAQRSTGAFVNALTAAGIPVRDAGELLDLSPQRISQLTNTHTEAPNPSHAITKSIPR